MAPHFGGDTAAPTRTLPCYCAVAADTVSQYVTKKVFPQACGKNLVIACYSLFLPKEKPWLKPGLRKLLSPYGL